MDTENPLRMVAPKTGVTVRMYRLNGLGDCFLLAFPSQDGSPFYLLIDCGVLLGTREGADRMRAVAQNIEQATGGHLHALVATHQHWDHLSGFKYAQEVFDRLRIDQVWLGWTEDPQNLLAQELSRKRNFALQALHATVARLQGVNDLQMNSLSNLLDFYGEPLAAGNPGSTEQMMKYVSERVSQPRYLRPSNPPFSSQDLPDVRFFTLGPPEDREWLTLSEPSGESGEVYERAEALNVAASFCAAALGADPQASSPEVADLFERSLPFDRTRALPLKDAEAHPEFGAFFHCYYGLSDQEGEGPAWRRIDTDWLSTTAADLALDLDNDTNNTSLALAIELLPSGKVLLFPGDAQVGNWLSWQKLEWPSGEKESIKCIDLLKRTVLYKVGHHGSHNATLRTKGLELMNHPELVALIPVVEKQARDKEWAMPFSPLLQRLQEKTQGRILRMDQDETEKPEQIHLDVWDRFVANCGVDASPDHLWVEYTVTG